MKLASSVAATALMATTVAGMGLYNTPAEQGHSNGGQQCENKPQMLQVPYGAGGHMVGYPVYPPASHVMDLAPIGSHVENIAEAGDARNNPELVGDGKSGDSEWPHGKLKPIATVGEVGDDKFTLTGVPDGMGSYLVDQDTVRMVWQSESYGNIHAYETYPFYVNDETTSFTGSHVMFVDYDREGLETFLNHDHPAESLVKNFEEGVKTMINLKGERVGPRMGNATHPEATTVGAHYGNTDAEGNWVTASRVSDSIYPTYADWVWMSLCAAHLEEREQWGHGHGLEDRLFITNEEWTYLQEDAEGYVGLSAFAVDVATQTSYAVGSMTNSGFEKIIEIPPQHTDYVVFSLSGYNGAFGDYDKIIENRNEVYGERNTGGAYVKPQNICPARIYVGKKGYNAKGEPADDFLSRNGLAYGKVYGFATDVSVTGWRDQWHKEHYMGDTVEGAFYPISWQWDGEVVDFIHDGAWEFQDKPVGAPDNMEFWNGAGYDTAGKKTEHNAPSYTGGSKFVQSSTGGYFGEYDVNGLKAALANLAEGEDFPASIDADYYLYQGETSIVDLIDLGGKGLRADGKYQTHMHDSNTEHATFEDIDGIETLATDEGDYLIIQEDGGNIFGERMFLTHLNKNAAKMDYKFVAMSGGAKNTRVMEQVGVPAGTYSRATSNEFSGCYDMTAYFSRDNRGKYALQPSDPGHKKHDLERVNINEKTMVVGLQAHHLASGAIQYVAGDRGGQWLVYQPEL